MRENYLFHLAFPFHTKEHKSMVQVFSWLVFDIKEYCMSCNGCTEHKKKKMTCHVVIQTSIGDSLIGFSNDSWMDWWVTELWNKFVDGSLIWSFLKRYKQSNETTFLFPMKSNNVSKKWNQKSLQWSNNSYTKTFAKLGERNLSFFHKSLSTFRIYIDWLIKCLNSEN